MVQNKILSYIGLATKAGKTVSGEFSTEKAIKSKTAKLVIVAEDASDNTKKNFTDSCSYYKVPLCVIGTKEVLGHSMGKEMRASLAVLDEGLADRIRKLYRETNENGTNTLGMIEIGKADEYGNNTGETTCSRNQHEE